MFWCFFRAFASILPNHVPVQVLEVNGAACGASIVFHEESSMFLVSDDSTLSHLSKLRNKPQPAFRNQGKVLYCQSFFKNNQTCINDCRYKDFIFTHFISLHCWLLGDGMVFLSSYVLLDCNWRSFIFSISCNLLQGWSCQIHNRYIKHWIIFFQLVRSSISSTMFTTDVQTLSSFNKVSNHVDKTPSRLFLATTHRLRYTTHSLHSYIINNNHKTYP